MSEPYNLARFVEAQKSIYPYVLQELRAGSKTRHWMWFIFPQIAGLGRSPTAQRFAISSREEARAFLEHPLLGPRLRECTLLVNQVEGRSVEAIFGNPDDLKFRSSMTLFLQVADDKQVFVDALNKYFGGEPDSRTLELL